MQVFVFNSIFVLVVVTIHYEIRFRLTRLLPRLRGPHRYRIVTGIFGALAAHALEIRVFAAAYQFMHHADGWDRLSGNFDGSLMDCAYFSFTVFTTPEFGDIEPLGERRYLGGVESLTGLDMITWSASFLFVEMQRRWNPR